MKFTLDLHVKFKSYASKMEEYISSLVNILVSWYAFYPHLKVRDEKKDEPAVLNLYLTPSLMQEYLVPQEYVQIMREHMLNKCPVSPYNQVCEVVKRELGETPDKVDFLG